MPYPASRKGATVPRWELNERSIRKVRDFLCEPHNSRFGCGSERTVAEYQAYCGLDFAHCRAQEYTLQELEPPNPPADPDWPTVPRPWQITVTLQRALLQPPFLAGDSVWQLSFFDPDGTLLSTKTLTGRDRDTSADEDARLSLTHTFSSARTPVRWHLSASPASRGRPAQIGGDIISADRKGISHSAYIASRVAAADTG
ncbi:MAG TPA: hypothetical protein VGI74_03745 [Streptosporangiaceae bacterium]